jgi:phosphatidylinositol kinase/protein kinase (PI-3  family)
MDGVDSEIFQYFKSLMIRGFFEIRKNLDDILVLIEILMKDSRMPCFKKPKTLLAEIRDRMSLKYNTNMSKETDYFELVDRLVKDSLNAWSTT